MRAFKLGQRVKVVMSSCASLIGSTGTVVRLRRADDQAWVRMDAEPPAELRQFPADDENGRGNHIMLWPDECERANGIGNGEQVIPADITREEAGAAQE